jgi:hypothetical protein
MTAISENCKTASGVMREKGTLIIVDGELRVPSQELIHSLLPSVFAV